MTQGLAALVIILLLGAVALCSGAVTVDSFLSCDWNDGEDCDGGDDEEPVSEARAVEAARHVS